MFRKKAVVRSRSIPWNIIVAVLLILGACVEWKYGIIDQFIAEYSYTYVSKPTTINQLLDMRRELFAVDRQDFVVEPELARRADSSIILQLITEYSLDVEPTLAVNKTHDAALFYYGQEKIVHVPLSDWYKLYVLLATLRDRREVLRVLGAATPRELGRGIRTDLEQLESRICEVEGNLSQASPGGTVAIFHFVEWKLWVYNNWTTCIIVTVVFVLLKKAL